VTVESQQELREWHFREPGVIPEGRARPVTDGHCGHGVVCWQQMAEGCRVTSFDVAFQGDEIDLVTHPDRPSRTRGVEEAME
jgi:hypothetical protein